MTRDKEPVLLCGPESDEYAWVAEFEPPIFGPSSHARLRKDMIISIDIPLFNTPWGGLRVEDGYWISGGGAKRLNNTPYWIEK
jgi:Xaa-Pro aminopeptidase